MSRVNELDSVLPQTQCGECGYKGCMPYAEAIAQGSESIDKCPPGGSQTLISLAEITGIDATPYLDSVNNNTRPPQVAKIREQECIGCTKCIQACPVDAIIGTGKQMHSILEVECTGCNLCVDPCPVDCIDMHELTEPLFDKDVSRQRFLNRQARLLREEQKKRKIYLEARRLKPDADDKKAKQDYILKALQRTKNKAKA